MKAIQDIKERGYQTKGVTAYDKELLKREGYSISHRPLAVEARVKSIGVYG
jgi:hypothetical protein